MKKSISGLVIFLFFILFVPFHTLADGCIKCHKELENALKAPAEAFQMDVHQKYGLSCTSCHGGNPEQEDIDAKDDSFKGVPLRKDIPELCGSCHSDSLYMRKFNPNLRVDQMELYWTSQHGQLLKTGDIKVAVCTDCHGIHGILESSHPRSWIFPWNIPSTCGHCHSNKEYMKDYSISVYQAEDYKQSVHAHALLEKKDLSAPVCNDCHGNHGAAPPEVTSIGYVCRQCHPSASELFSESPHKEAFDELEISECEACHGNHKILPPSDEMLGTGEGAVCIECHDPESTAYKIATTIKDELDDFKSKMLNAENKLQRADKQGVEISEARFRLQEAHTTLIQVRNLTHSFSLDKIEEKIKEGTNVIAEVSEAGDSALKEAKFRKRGLIVATFFIFLLAIALLFKIKQIEKKIPQ
ncbi:MAG: cytochrome c3 family protein [Candidatus Aminicenantes bacterium]|nr:cytochrome c3 family protein [Candidatus Aminicenantes bacterium]MDH5745105.1 cytochrome c3 family protein [Candidatus Aminicenantes bacterium]